MYVRQREEGEEGAEMEEVIGGVRELRGEELYFAFALKISAGIRRSYKAPVRKWRQPSHHICAESFCCVSGFGTPGQSLAFFRFAI